MSDIQTHNFVTSIYYKDLNLSQELIDHCLKKELDNVEENRTSFFRPTDETLRKLTLDAVFGFFTEVGKNLGFDGLRLDNTWVQKYNIAEQHRVHVHGLTVNEYSFVCYIDCTENSGSTIFYNIGYPYVDTGYHKIKPKVGRCVLFPGSVPHEAQANKDEKRIIVSGNITFLRKDQFEAQDK